MQPITSGYSSTHSRKIASAARRGVSKLGHIWIRLCIGKTECEPLSVFTNGDTRVVAVRHFDGRAVRIRHLQIRTTCPVLVIGVRTARCLCARATVHGRHVSAPQAGEDAALVLAVDTNSIAHLVHVFTAFKRLSGATVHVKLPCIRGVHIVPSWDATCGIRVGQWILTLRSKGSRWTYTNGRFQKIWSHLAIRIAHACCKVVFVQRIDCRWYFRTIPTCRHDFVATLVENTVPTSALTVCRHSDRLRGPVIL